MIFNMQPERTVVSGHIYLDVYDFVVKKKLKIYIILLS